VVAEFVVAPFVVSADLGTVSIMASRTARRTLVTSPVVEVMCDDAGRVGPLSYLVPDGLRIHVGDALRVPFGKAERYGVAVGDGDAGKATREVLEVFGPRTDLAEIALAASLAVEHFCAFSTVAPRLGPRTRRGNLPVRTGPVVLVDGPDAADLGYPAVDDALRRRLLAPAPAVPAARLAALEAARLAAAGQVLVLCPTKQVVAQVLAEFADGAARLDVVPKAAEPSPWRGFVDGTVPVAVATRAAALWAAHDLAAVVVVDEDHPGHVESAQPYTNARTVAIRRTQATGAALTLIAAVPSLYALAGHVRLIPVGTPAHWPAARFVETGQLAPHDRAAPARVLAAIADARRESRPAFVVAPAASSTPRCRRCKRPGAVDDVCARCGGEVRVSGLSKERVAELFPKATAVSVAELLTAKPRPGALVVLLAADTYDAAADITPSRTIAQVCAAATRLAGAGGEVVALTRAAPPATLLDLVLRPNVRRHAKRIWAEAKASSLPPFSTQVQVRYQRASAPKVPSFPAPIRVLGPRKVADGEFETLVFVPPDRLAELEPWIASLRRTGRVQIQVSG
jgi:primosomal protein N'